MIHNLQIIANEISLLIRKTAMNDIQEYDLVALTEDAIATHKVTHQQILLRRGQMGGCDLHLITRYGVRILAFPNSKNNF
jgi:hypothetical protein